MARQTKRDTIAALLQQNPAISAIEIADAVGISRQAVYQHIATLDVKLVKQSIRPRRSRNVPRIIGHESRMRALYGDHMAATGTERNKLLRIARHIRSLRSWTKEGCYAWWRLTDDLKATQRAMLQERRSMNEPEPQANKWRVDEVRTIARNFLLAAPNGLTARTLCDAIMQQGIPENAASLIIRSGLDEGLIRLGPNLQLMDRVNV